MNIDIIDIDTVDSATCRIDGVEYAKAGCAVSAYGDLHAQVVVDGETFIVSHGSSVDGRRPIGQAALVYAIESLLAGASRQQPTQVSAQPLPLISPAPTVTLTKATGVSLAVIAGGGSGYVVGDELTLAGGTAFQPAKLYVTAVSGGAITGVFILKAGAYTTAPSNPASQASTTGSGTGATFTLTFNAGVASTVENVKPATDITLPAFVHTGYGVEDKSFGYYGPVIDDGTANIMEWCSDAPKMDLRVLGANSHYGLFVDGRRAHSATITTDSSGAPHIITVDWAGVRTPRTYQLVCVGMHFAGVTIDVYSSLWAPSEPRRPLAWQLGDSYTFGTIASLFAFNDFRVMCDSLGWDGLPDGIGGKGWLSTAADAPQTRTATKLAAINRAPDYLLFSLGVNDAGGNMTTLATNFDATIAAARAAFPAARIIVIGPATPVGSTAPLTAVKDALDTRCTALGLTFIDVDDWVNSANKAIYTDGDNVHPTDAGYTYRGGRLAQAVAAIL